MSGKVCIVPRLSGLGGPAAFSSRLIAALKALGVTITQDLDEDGISAVLVMGGTRRLLGLWQAKRRGARLVQRLNGMNWVHRQAATGLRHFLRAEINNWILSTIRSRLVERIIYQSQFSLDWWQRVYGAVPASSGVIYNGVDLQEYSPSGDGKPPQDRIRILAVEGRYGSGYDTGLQNAVTLVNALNRGLAEPVYELMVAGVVPAQNRQRIEASGARVSWVGVVAREGIPELDRSAHVFFSADLNAACPNAVIEALACGLPVAAYATGALPEMVTGGAGVCVPYGADHWKLEAPQVEPLVRAVKQIAGAQAEFRADARRRAEQAFDIHHIVDAYLDVLLG